MKNSIKITAMLLGFAAVFTQASTAQTVQDNFHLRQVNPCFDSPAPAQFYLETQTNQKLLFTANTGVYILVDNNIEIPTPAKLAVYLDINSSNYTALLIFDDGVTCLLSEGGAFNPYTSP